MRRSTTGVVLVAAALIALGGGCRASKGRQIYRDVTGEPQRATVELNTASRT